MTCRQSSRVPLPFVAKQEPRHRTSLERRAHDHSPRPAGDKLRARYKGAHGGRGSGKSHSFALLASSKGLKDPLRILCCREFQYSIDQSVKHIVERKIRDLGMAHMMRSARTYTILDLGAGDYTEFIYEGLHLNTSAIRSMENVTFVGSRKRRPSRSIAWTILFPPFARMDRNCGFPGTRTARTIPWIGCCAVMSRHRLLQGWRSSTTRSPLFGK